LLGVALPPVLAFSVSAFQDSISAYYYTGARDWFVGTLWVVGMFLIFYRYRPRHPETATSRSPAIKSGFADACLGKVAGTAALVVALVPTAPTVALSNQPPIIGMWHGLAAFVLFVALALFPLLLFSQAREGAALYKWLGGLMLILVLMIAAYAFAPEDLRSALAPWKPVLVLEWVLIWIFGIAWFMKGLVPRDSTLDRPADPFPQSRS
jgi:hypothetical protein